MASVPVDPATTATSKQRAPVQVYSGPAGKQEMYEHYEEQLKALPWPCESRMVETRFGKAHVLVCGPPSGRPLVAWHGKGFPGPHMVMVYSQLVNAGYRMYTPDEPCDAGSRSEDIPVDPANNGWGWWALDVVQGLGLLEPGLPVPVHTGMSFGGAVILDLMAVAPRSVAAAALIVPICVHPDYGGFWSTMTMIFRVALPIMLFMMLPCKLTQRWACESFMGDWTYLPKQITLCWKHLRYNGQPPPRFEPGQLDAFRGPVLGLFAENDIFGGSHAAARRLEQLVPGSETRVLPMKHAPTLAQSEDVVARVLRFFEEKGFGPKL